MIQKFHLLQLFKKYSRELPRDITSSSDLNAKEMLSYNVSLSHSSDGSIHLFMVNRCPSTMWKSKSLNKTYEDENHQYSTDCRHGKKTLKSIALF